MLCYAPGTCSTIQNPSLTFGKGLQGLSGSEVLRILLYSWFLATTIHSRLSPYGHWVIHFEHVFRSGYTSSIGMTSHTSSRPTWFYMPAPVDPRRAKTIWPWRFQSANLAMRDFVSVASTAPHSILMGIRRTSRFAEM